MDDEHYFDLLQGYPIVFELEGLSRGLGPEHPTVRVLADARKSLDAEKLEAAQAAFDALPEQVVNRALYPWTGGPPPSYICELYSASKLIGKAYGRDPVRCYLQIDAREGGGNSRWPADRDGHVVDPALVYEPRVYGWPVRVQIMEGSNREVVKDLLRKILDTLDRDWDMLIDPDSYPTVLPMEVDLENW